MYNSTSIGYKGKGASSADLTAIKRKLAEARGYSQTDKKRGTLRMTDLVSFKPTFNVYSQITGVPLGGVGGGYTSTFNGPYTNGVRQVTLPGPTTSVTVVFNDGVDIDTVFNLLLAAQSGLPSCTASATGVSGFLSQFTSPQSQGFFYSSTDPPSPTPFGATGTFSVTFTFSTPISGVIVVDYNYN